MILFILAIALVLRLVAINQSLWLDEAINVNNAASLDFKSLLLNYSLSDFHPPLYHALLKLWIMAFGTAEISVRLPSVVFGVVAVYFTYLTGKKLYGEKTALIASTLMATAPLAVYYSQEARMYALAAAAASASVYFFISLIKKDTFLNWSGFIASTVVMLYSDYLPYLLIPTYFAYLLINKKIIKKPTFNAFLPAFIIIFFLLSPWFFIFPKQVQTGLSAAAASPAWAQVVGSPQLLTLPLTLVKFTIGRISSDNNLVYMLLFSPVALFTAFLFALSTLRLSKLRSFTLYWLFIPVTLGFVVSFFVPVFAYFRFIFILPAFYLILASAINLINWPPYVRTMLALFLVINLTSSAIYFLNPKFQREDWKAATAYVTKGSGEKTVTLFESSFTLAPFDYYNTRKLSAFGALDSFSPNQMAVEENVKKYTEGKDKVFLFQYLGPITDPQGLVFKELSDIGFVNTSTKDFNGVGFVYKFERAN